MTWLSSFYVAPRPLDIQAQLAKLKNLDEYPALLSTFCVIIGTSLICMIWARRKDISDTGVVSSFPFVFCFVYLQFQNKIEIKIVISCSYIDIYSKMS